MKCPSCNGLRVVIDRFDKSSHICEWCGGTGVWLNIYKTLALSIVEPVAEIDLDELEAHAEAMKVVGNEVDDAIAEMLLRCVRFIRMSLGLVKGDSEVSDD